MSELNTISSEVTSYDVDDGTVLFIEQTRELLRLNPTAALVWRGYRAGLSFQEMIEALVRVTGASAAAVERDVAALIKELEDIGALQRRHGLITPASPRKQSSPTANLPVHRRYRRSHSRDSQATAHSYQLVDFQFRLRRLDPPIGRDADRLFAHLRVSDSDAPATVVEVVEDRDEWLLLYDGNPVDRCANSAAIVPMLHANVLLTAYRTSDCMAALHASAVIRNDRCVLMPGTSGSGKTTLTAALLANGFGYCSDDLVLLTSEPIRIRPVPTCLGLKSGSWNIVSSLFPEIHQLPTHVRPDGKQIRYLSPKHSIEIWNSYRADFLVFPVWSSGHASEIRRIGSGEALERLTASGYDLPNRINSDVVARLLRWVSELRCFELRYDSIEDAVRTVSDLMP